MADGHDWHHSFENTGKRSQLCAKLIGLPSDESVAVLGEQER